MTGTSASRGPRPEAAEQAIVDDDHVGRGPAALARQLLSAAGLGHEDDVRQRAQQGGDRPPAGARHVGEQHARRPVGHGPSLKGG